jgi:anti-sigma factor RsiW
MNDDTLILYYYNDGLTDRERRQVESAIKSDAAVAAQYETICRQLGDIREPDIPVVPPHTLQRWHDSIDRAAQRERRNQQKPARQFRFFSLAWGAAVTAALVIGIGIGSYLSTGSNMMSTIGVANIEPGAAAVVPAAFTRGVTVYLRDTQQELAAMPIATAADQSTLIMQIIEQNRLFERAAEQNNSQSLARVLRAFEPILLRLAADDIAPQDAAALRKQLTFELKVMLTKLSRDTSKETHTT